MDTPDADKLRHIEIMDREVAEIMRRKSGAERLAMGHAMWRSMRNRLLAMLHEKHPDWTDEDVQREVARRMCRGG